MKIQENVSLAQYSAMKLGGKARFLAEITNEDELLEALEFASDRSLEMHTIGEGSNTIFSDAGFDGLILVNKVGGIVDSIENDALVLTVGSGENWDELVEQTVVQGFSDIAALSKIPGTVGAAPVQNIGAYGQQVSDTVISVRAYDLNKRTFITISKEDCDFTYRHSRFNQTDKGRFIITQVTMRLSRKNVSPPFYADVEHYFASHALSPDSVTASDLRRAVSEVRAKKLPDPSVVANCGSFFGNPKVDAATFNKLLREHPQLKSHSTDDGQLKLYAGQLIELAGMKNYRDEKTGMATWKNQALVLVNESARSTADLIEFKQKIVANVQAMFGITLIQEPELVESGTIT